jgi:DNA-binding IclR family transcriptional regulator
MVRTTNDTVAPSQTLDRGLAVLEAVAEADAPITTADVAALVGVHRSIAYRLLRTLELRNLVARDEAGGYLPGARLAILARAVQVDLRTAAAPELRRLADEFAVTAFVVARDGDDAVTIATAEPTTTDVHVVYRPGTRHPVDRGAPGLAMLAARGAQTGERREVRVARRRGWATSTGEVIAGMRSIAAPIDDVGAIAVLWMAGHGPADEDAVGEAVAEAGRRIASILR